MKTLRSHDVPGRNYVDLTYGCDVRITKECGGHMSQWYYHKKRLVVIVVPMSNHKWVIYQN